jgi:aspartate/methionine/tyrosine aminotransferase
LRDRTILLYGWSKTYAMTGWRLGYSVWPGGLVDAAERLCVNSHSCVNAAAQFAGIEALSGPQDAVDAMMEAFDARRRLIADLLNAVPGVSCPDPGGAFYVFPNVAGTGMDGRTLQSRLLEEAGVATIAGASFGDTAADNIRFSYANSEANIREAIDRMRRMLEAA